MTMDSRSCPHCGAALVETRQAAPYIGPGARLVTLRDVPAFLCPLCDHLELDLIDRAVLDKVIRCGVEIMSERTRTVAFTQGRWRLVP